MRVNLMDGDAVVDLILRAIAALRERGELPASEAPRLTVTRVGGRSTDSYHANVGQTLAAAQSDLSSAQSPEALGAIVADYLSELVDLVPAYSDVAAIELSERGAIVITLR